MPRKELSLRLISIPAVMVAVLTIIVVLNLRQSQNWVEHTQEVTEGLHLVFSDLKDMEAAQRGFLLTRNDSYLKMYSPAAAELDTEMKKLAELLTHGPFRTVRFQNLEQEIREKRVEMDNTIELGKANRFDLALAVVGTGIGRAKMEGVRAIIGRMSVDESLFLRSLLKRVYTLVYVLAGLLAACAFLISTALWQLSVKVRQLVSARGALQTAHDDLEEKVRARTEELARTNQELERFAYMASHDLQEPLRKISMMTDLLSRADGARDTASQEKFVNAIQLDANRMRDMIVGMLNLSRIGAKDVPRQEVDTAKVVDDVLRVLEVSVTEAQASVKRGTLPTVIANETQMQQVFQNLIGNALKFHGERAAEIEVGAERDGARWRFYVRDNGIGLDEKYAERIFDAFERLHGKDRYAGSGLGLAICKKIVDSSGGRIWVEAKPDQGSTFFFTLPGTTQTTK